MGILSWLIVGLIAGWLAGLVMKGGGYGLVGDIVLGIIGALVGGFLGETFFGLGGVSGINVGSILIAFVGAVIILFAVRLVSGRRGV
ncbi:MAG: GlsB/YeaQ/YmgE family stress response membrane protein [Anaerolineae bacterium]